MTSLAERTRKLQQRASGWQAWTTGPSERYRIVRRTDDGPVTIASTPTREGIGIALCTLAEEGALQDQAIGILDSNSHTWIVNPWAGRRP